MQDLVMERFRVIERVGSGGMGSVYRAYDERLEREVALKELGQGDPERVLREAQAAARLNHPAIVTLYELGEHAGRAVLVSELVPGETLAQLRDAGALYDRDVAEIVVDLCEALAHAHARGVVHRDIKPENVIVCDDARAGRRAKLMDFGIARVAGAPTLTATGEVVGTLAYMSPEQADGDLAGPPTDVYSLALTAYECWAGVNPVAGRTPAETARRIGAGVAPLGSERPDLPAGLAETIDACLEPEPALRPTPGELLDRVEAELPGLDTMHALVPVEGGDSAGVHDAAAGSARRSLVALLSVSLAPLFAAMGIAGAAAALGAPATSVPVRAMLGALAWAWIVVGSAIVGFDPGLGLPATFPGEVGAQLVSADSLLGAGVFALGSLALGWVLRTRHLSLALLGAMIWAAALNAALAAIDDGSLAERPAGIVLAAAGAAALEFGVLRKTPAGRGVRGYRVSTP